MAIASKNTASEITLLPLEGSFWKYFRFLARDRVFLEAERRKRKEVMCKVVKVQRQRLKHVLAPSHYSPSCMICLNGELFGA